ncbi:hypothetical protein QTP86_014646 [Hemibagrus guttatus]|nr:hypothetical protein QTP86_014646 [Hemibagrus guttatus]
MLLLDSWKSQIRPDERTWYKVGTHPDSSLFWHRGGGTSGPSGVARAEAEAPQGCVLSKLLFTLLTHDCAAMHSLNHIIKFADDMTVVVLFSKNDESAYREVVQRLTAWCKANNLSLNADKTKEMVVDFRRAQSDHSLLNINGYDVEMVNSLVFTWRRTSPGHSTPAPSPRKPSSISISCGG